MNYVSKCMVSGHLHGTEKETLTIQYKVLVSSSQTLICVRIIWRAYYNMNCCLPRPSDFRLRIGTFNAVTAVLRTTASGYLRGKNVCLFIFVTFFPATNLKLSVRPL